jgi:hypothetical protein
MRSEAETRGRDGWEGWHRRRKVGRKKVSRSLSAEVVWNLRKAWYFAAQALGLDFNLFVTVRPIDIDSYTPAERIERWWWFREKVAQYARDHGFEGVQIWSRESDPGGAGEHLHLLTHIPPDLVRHFMRTASGWLLEDRREIDLKRANYTIRWTPRGKARSMIGYITKNSPQAAFGTRREYRKGGPILGKRAGCSRNIDERARVRERREAAYASVIEAWMPRQPAHPARQWEQFGTCW